MTTSSTIRIGNQSVPLITLPDGRRAVPEQHFRRIMAHIDH
jgi:hypothetical protein